MDKYESVEQRSMRHEQRMGQLQEMQLNLAVPQDLNRKSSTTLHGKSRAMDSAMEDTLSEFHRRLESF